MKKIALFPGSFDPFTLGHHNLVERALRLSDEVIIAIGHNDAKRSLLSLEERIDYLRRLYASTPSVRIESYTGLTVDYARHIGATFVLRGVRTVDDFEYERTIADVNQHLEGIETLLMFSDTRWSWLSSTVVRELLAHGKDISSFLPMPLTLNR